ncbi:hypothetical protein K1T71_014568 [Dendrolimus kikuchii]|uniref:Uncharacterized protein n=1 Tax=Dendrolimus kikuchii TaxID=765133 RepID=A0ACC1CEM6_9NEOP|nr:hypothetical protein K1T71_014568 [Dendrolimus kikuchii]
MSYRFLIRDFNYKIWSSWTRNSVNSVFKRCRRERSVKDVIQCMKQTFFKPRRTFLLAVTAAFKAHDDETTNSDKIISDEDLEGLLTELELVEELSKRTLFCRHCGQRLVIGQRCRDVRYCACKDASIPNESLDGWVPYMEADDVIIWRKEYKHGQGLYAYKVYGRYKDVSRLFANRDYVYVRRHKEFDIKTCTKTLKDRLFNEKSVEEQKPKYEERPSVHSNAKRKAREAELRLAEERRSCEHPKVPETKHAIRVNEYWSHMVVKTLEGADKTGMEFVLTYYDEPAVGGLPSGVAAWATGRAAPAYLDRMRAAALDYRRWTAEKGGQELHELVPLVPDRILIEQETANEEKEVSEQEMESSRLGPELNGNGTNGKPVSTEPVRSTRDASTQTEDDGPHSTTLAVVKDTEEKAVGTTEAECETLKKQRKDSPSEEEKKEKILEEEEEKGNGSWWRYLYPFYYFV